MAENKGKPEKIFLWVVPRSLSTSFIKFMSFVDNISVWFEPYSMSNINKTIYNPKFMADNEKVQQLRKNVASREQTALEIIKATPRGPHFIDQAVFSYGWVKEQLKAALPEGKNYLFCKDHPWALDGINNLPEEEFQHTFLIRHPSKVFTSLKKVNAEAFFGDKDKEHHIFDDIPVFKQREIYKNLYDLWKWAVEKGSDPVVIDSDDVTSSPETVLPEYFKRIGIPWSDRYLRWDAGQDIIQTWHCSYEFTAIYSHNLLFSRAFNCSHFEKTSSSEPIEVDALTPDVQDGVRYSLPFYQEMYEHRIRPSSFKD